MLKTNNVALNTEDFRIFYENASDIYCIIGDDGTLLAVNPSFRKALGYTREEMIGKFFHDFMHPDDREKSIAAYDAFVKKGRTVDIPTFENRYIHKDGNIRWILWSGSHSAKNQAAYCTGKDITELKLKERGFQEMQSIAKIGSWRLRVSDMSYTWSDEVYKIYGFSSSTPLNLVNSVSFYSPESQTEILAAIMTCIQTGKSFDIESSFIDANGEKKRVRSIGDAVRSRGKTTEIHGIFQDITVSYRQQLELEEQRAKMIQISKMSALGEMACGVAHEINNPLSIIQGRAQLLEKKYPELKSEITPLLNGVSRIDKIIRSMATFSRGGENDLSQHFSAEQWVTDVYELAKEHFERNAVNFTHHIPPSVEMYGRPTQLGQILINLLTNAVDAVSDLSEKWIDVSITSKVNAVEVRVKDSGTGIPRESRERIFQPFFTTKPIGKGTGIGLSIAQKLAHEHSGSLDLDPKSDHTCFVLTLPKLTQATDFLEKF